MAKRSKAQPTATATGQRRLSAAAVAALVPFVSERTLLGRVCGDIVGDFQLRSRRAQEQRPIAEIVDYLRHWPAAQAALIKADLI